MDNEVAFYDQRTKMKQLMVAELSQLGGRESGWNNCPLENREVSIQPTVGRDCGHNPGSSRLEFTP